MDGTELLMTVRPYLQPVVPAPGQPMESALEWTAQELAYLARTFLDFNGPLDQEMLDLLKRTLAQVTAEAPV